MSSATAAFYGLLSASLVLYVYRFAIGGMNLSIFRAVFLAWVAWLAVDVARGRIRLERRLRPFALVVAALIAVNAVDFLTLGGYPALRRDIANHLVNVGLTGLVLIYVDTEARLHALIRAFVLSSIVTSAVTLYAALLGRLPFEPLIRSLGSAMGQTLAYVSDDAEFQRATSSFFDPNFYGIYSLLVVASILYLWLYERPAWWLAVLFVINVICLTLTLSRTAVIGLLAALGVAFVLERRTRLFAVAAAGATIALLYASTIYQSHTQFDQLVKSVGTLTASVVQPAPPPARPPSATPPPAAPRRPAGDAVASDDIQERVANTRSLSVRVEYVQRGLALFHSSPIWGRGSASLLTPTVRWSTAHVTYVTLLARYGVLGAAVYLVFLLLPPWVVWRRPRPMSHRFLVTVPLAALLVVYLSYDVMLFFEVQYLVFGWAWAVACNLTPPAVAGHAA